MSEQEDSAFVDSFFLPGGILDPSSYEEEREAAKQKRESIQQQSVQPVSLPFQIQSAPSQNPWASESSQPQVSLQARDLAAAVKQEATAQQEVTIPRPVVTEPQAGPSAWKDNRVLDFSSPPVANGISHVTTPVRTTESAVSPFRNGNTSFETVKSPLQSSSPYYLDRSAASPSLSSALQQQSTTQPQHVGLSYESSPAYAPEPAFRAPPGFEATAALSPHVERKLPPAAAIQEEHDSMRSDSSVPHELFDSDGDSAASSLSSGSHESHESSPLEDNMEEEEEEDLAGADNEETPALGNGIKETSKCQETPELSAEIVVEPQAPKPDTTERQETPETDRQETTETEPEARSKPKKETSTRPRIPSGHRNRQRKKSKHEKSKPTKSERDAKQEERQLNGSQTAQKNGHWLRNCLSALALFGIKAFAGFSQFTGPVWRLLGRILRRLCFDVLRFLGTAVSVCAVVGKNAFLEVAQKPSVPLCYFFMCFTPDWISVIMRRYILPHWVPHVISSCIMYELCNLDDSVRERTRRQRAQIDAGTSATTTTSRKEMLRIERVKREVRGAGTSELVLGRIRTLVPIMFFLDGFSNEIGSVMSVSRPGRLVIAFVVSALRRGLWISPVMWISLAYQILLATYYHSVLIYVYILFLGISSLRFSAFLQEQTPSSLKS